MNPTAPAHRHPPVVRYPVREYLLRWLRARAMALTQIGDMATASLTDNTSAIPDSVVDNFEDSPDGPYATGEDLSDYYSGHLSVMSRISSGTILEGSVSLEIDAGTDGSHHIITSIPGDGLPNYPQQGDTFEAVMYGLDSYDGDRMGVLFGVQDNHDGTDNWDGLDAYFAFVRPADNQIDIERIADGSATVLSSTSTTVPHEETLRTVVDWGTDDSIDVTVYDSNDSEVGSTSTTDDTFTSGGIGWEGTGVGGTHVVLDGYTIQ